MTLRMIKSTRNGLRGFTACDIFKDVLPSVDAFDAHQHYSFGSDAENEGSNATQHFELDSL